MVPYTLWWVRRRLAAREATLGTFVGMASVVAAEVCAVIRPVVRTSDPMMSNEVLLERVAMAYQARFTPNP